MRILSNLGAMTLEYLVDLIRINTVNPPGNEVEACKYLKNILKKEDIPFTAIESAPGRGNIVARLKGSGTKRPFLLNAHLDVVPVERDKWSFDPFGSVIDNGFLYGRGAIDMKQMVAMALSILVTLRRECIFPSRDLIVAFVADEEAGCQFGSAFLVKNQKDLIDAEYGLTEGGGFALKVKNNTYISVCIAEKGVLWLRLDVHGQAGHASVPISTNAVVRLSNLVSKISRIKFPTHLSEPMKQFFFTLARNNAEKLTKKAFYRLFLNKRFTPYLMPIVLGLVEDNNGFNAMVRNTLTPTNLKAGSKENVIPSIASVNLDCRLLPGFSSENFLKDVKKRLTKEELTYTTFTILQDQGPSASRIDTPFYKKITQTIAKVIPEAIPIPFLTPGFTDAHFYRKLGMHMYGFIPMNVSSGNEFLRLFHGNNERISLENLDFGSNTLMDLTRSVLFE